MLQPLSLYSVELTDEEWERVKNSYQILEIVTQERNDLRKDKEALMMNNEIILKERELGERERRIDEREKGAVEQLGEVIKSVESRKQS